jgi:nicotinamidase-related amidase
MPVTTLDTKTALVLIDMQKGIVALPTAHPIDAVKQHCAALAKAFRAAGQPVVLVNVAGGAKGRAEQSRPMHDLPADWAELIADLDAQQEDHRVTKYTWGAFTQTDLDTWLRANHVTQIVLAGVATSIGVESTARFAQELGYNITLVTDAMTDMVLEAHDNSVTRIFPRLGETGSTRDVIALLNAKNA